MPAGRPNAEDRNLPNRPTVLECFDTNMSSLKPTEKRGFEDLLGMGSGYVLDFSNSTFAEFFRDVCGTDIYHDRYSTNGDSKARRLRTFWEIEPDQQVGRALNELLDVWEYGNDPEGADKGRYRKCREIAARLSGEPVKQSESTEEFLGHKIELPSLNKLNLDSVVTSILSARLDEIEKGLRAKAPLSVIFLCGSILEGVLLGTAIRLPQKFNQSTCSPKDKAGKAKPLHEWSLAQLIDVASDLKLIKLDVKKFSHALRDFRNYIHPFEQMSSGFTPDPQTAEICFQVLKAALADLSKTR